MSVENDAILDTDSEDDFDWEEVAVPVISGNQSGQLTPNVNGEGTSSTISQSIEITIRARPKKDDSDKCVIFLCGRILF